MPINNSNSQTEKPASAPSIEAVEFRYVPVYELVLSIAFALIALICAAALIGGIISGTIQFNKDLAVVLATCFIACPLAMLSFPLVARSWLRIRIGEDIELHWWLRRVTSRIPLTNAQTVQLNIYISPIYGMRSEAVLTLMINDKFVELPVLRHLLPLKRFQQQALLLAQRLNAPLHIPDRDRIPPGFRNAFDNLRSVHDVNGKTIDALVEKLLGTPVTWQATEDAELQYRLTFDGQVCEIRVNDWPEHETVYSLLIAKELVRDLPALPDNWQLPNFNSN